MRRSRNIRASSLINLNLLKHPLPENDDQESHFGEEIPRENSPLFYKSGYVSSDDSDIVPTSIRHLSNSKSSSSSLSWGAECRSEASKQLHAELQRMNDVLRGVEPIPDNYDKDEYREWMELFPNLCVLGIKTGIYVQSASHLISKNEEIFAIHPDIPCDKIRDSVIDVDPKMTLDDIDIDDYLKVSSFGASKLPRRQSSSRSLISSQISSSKWLKDDDSLPFLPQARSVKGGRKGILKNSLVLPPIETNHFRSISATPRRESKSLSALSVKDQKRSGFKRTSGKAVI